MPSQSPTSSLGFDRKRGNGQVRRRIQADGVNWSRFPRRSEAQNGQRERATTITPNRGEERKSFTPRLRPAMRRPVPMSPDGERDIAEGEEDELRDRREQEEREELVRARENEKKESDQIEQEAALNDGEVTARRQGTMAWHSYAALFGIACFKDVLDFTILFALPIIAAPLTLCLLILMFLLSIFPRRKYKISLAEVISRDMTIFSLVFIIEGVLFPLNVLPFMVVAPLGMYVADKAFLKLKKR